jgi:hypothetical protein
LIDDQDAVEKVAADGAVEPFSDGVARDARTGVLTSWIPVKLKTAAKAAVNLESRSRHLGCINDEDVADTRQGWAKATYLPM